MRNTPDDYILNLHENKAKKITITLKIYSNLCHVVHLINPSLVGAVSLRMVELTMNNGLDSSSPLAFVHYGEVLLALGSVKEGCRLGTYHRMLSVLNHEMISLNHTTSCPFQQLTCLQED